MTSETTGVASLKQLQMDFGESFREIDKDGSYRKLAVYLTTLSEPQMYEIVSGRINASDMENLMDEVGIEPYRKVS